MNHSYKFTSIILSVFFSISSGLLFAQQDPTFIIKNMEANQDGLIGNYSFADAAVKITSVRYTQLTEPTISFDCIPGGNLIDYKYLKVADDVTSSPTNKKNSSYILIENTGNVAITKVEFIGFGSGSPTTSKCICGVSIDNSNFSLYKDEDSDFPLAKAMLFNYNDLVTSCTDANSGITAIDIPDTAYDIDGNIFTNFRDKAKYIRLNWGLASNEGFAGLITEKGSTPLIYGIKIYTEDISTNIDNDNTSQDDIEITLSEKQIKSNHIIDLNIYNTAGNLIKIYNNVQNIDLSNYPKGLYILKAISTNNGHVFVKKISLV